MDPYGLLSHATSDFESRFSVLAMESEFLGASICIGLPIATYCGK